MLVCTAEVLCAGSAREGLEHDRPDLPHEVGALPPEALGFRQESRERPCRRGTRRLRFRHHDGGHHLVEALDRLLCHAPRRRLIETAHLLLPEPARLLLAEASGLGLIESAELVLGHAAELLLPEAALLGLGHPARLRLVEPTRLRLVEPAGLLLPEAPGLRLIESARLGGVLLGHALLVLHRVLKVRP